MFPAVESMSQDFIKYEDFEKVDMRLGKILKAEEFPKARKPAYKLLIDFGDLGVKKSSAQLTKLYGAEQLIGRLVVAVVNFAPRQVADFMSEVLVLGISPAPDEVVLLEPERDAPLGSKVF